MDLTSIDHLPGSEIVRTGLRDLTAQRESAEGLALQMASNRFRALGFDVRASSNAEIASHRLYELLAETDPGGAHGRFNAISQRLVSFLNAAEHEG